MKTNNHLSFIQKIILWFRKIRYTDSLMDGRIYGRFYVKYPDGEKSMRMYYKTAKNYSVMFGGNVMYVASKNNHVLIN